MADVLAHEAASDARAAGWGSSTAPQERPHDRHSLRGAAVKLSDLSDEQWFARLSARR